jgi:uncharacterized protein (TIGR02284 family)
MNGSPKCDGAVKTASSNSWAQLFLARTISRFWCQKIVHARKENSAMSEMTERLSSLHTALVDARNGYQEALADADGKGLTSVFTKMIALHTSSENDIANRLRALGQEANDSGSFMSTVHRTVMRVRSLFGGLDSSILPGLIDGEKRILGYYDEAIVAASPATDEHAILTRHRAELENAIRGFQAMSQVAT